MAFASAVGVTPQAATAGTRILALPEKVRASDSVMINVTAPAGTSFVEFTISVDGFEWKSIAVDRNREDGWQAVWQPVAWEGPVQVRASAHPGAEQAIVTVRVANSAPIVTAQAAPTEFSPNGDGRKDATALVVTSSEPALADIRAIDRSGNTVRLLADDQLIAGAIRVTWDGRAASDARAPDGLYRLIADVRDLAGNAASASATIRIDTRAPRLVWTSRRGSIPSIGSVRIRHRIHDASNVLTGRFILANGYGRAMRRWDRHRLVPGQSATTLSARTVAALAPGVYRLRAVIQDAAANRSAARLSPAYRLQRSVRTRVLARVENAGRHVALTFDDCFFPSSWDSILRTLARSHVKGAFFCPGIRVQASPGLAARTVRAGHTIGSHGWDHALLTASGYSGTLWRLRRDRDVWWRWSQAATPYFRPPFGAFNGSVLAAAGAAGYRHTVVWDVDTRDWTNPGVAAIAARAVRPARPGSIILLHVKPQTAAALPQIIRGLRARGLTPIGLDDLLHRRGASGSRGGWSARSALPMIGE